MATKVAAFCNRNAEVRVIPTKRVAGGVPPSQLTHWFHLHVANNLAYTLACLRLPAHIASLYQTPGTISPPLNSSTGWAPLTTLTTSKRGIYKGNPWELCRSGQLNLTRRRNPVLYTWGLASISPSNFEPNIWIKIYYTYGFQPVFDNHRKKYMRSIQRRGLMNGTKIEPVG